MPEDFDSDHLPPDAPLADGSKRPWSYAIPVAEFIDRRSDLACLFRGQLRGRPTPGVFGTGNGFEMLWIDARSSATEMVDIKSFRDRPNVVLIEIAVSHHRVRCPWTFATPVAGVEVSEPQPASSLRIDVVAIENR